MFVRPEQIAAISRRHPEIGRLRLVINRADEQDQAELRAETAQPSEGLSNALKDTAAAIMNLRCDIMLVAPGSLPNDGKVIADDRR